MTPAARRLTVATFAAAVVTGLSAGDSLTWWSNLAQGLTFGVPVFAVVAGGLSAVAWAVKG